MFEYDPSGNLVKDGLNRLEFSYNCLNLMQTAETASGALKAQFTYGSDGRKLSEKAKTGGFEYLGSLIYAYRGGTLSLVQAVTDEGTIQSVFHQISARIVLEHLLLLERICQVLTKEGGLQRSRCTRRSPPRF